MHESDSVRKLNAFLERYAAALEAHADRELSEAELALAEGDAAREAAHREAAVALRAKAVRVRQQSIPDLPFMR
ncbi:hypothetical protein [Pyxidicoccus sp. MSG2]|uniref:hypothetical protein n=1 Tax=Pyxidicoccus sp. MSG2 TaxID=2996790 RepID=UPI00227194D2|nr:hypothetical protein [Pyxidicoccus sp. MSG2]MCY1024053.1 hypothetical protein [Pyxidicoccus sp. MSG2]